VRRAAAAFTKVQAGFSAQNVARAVEEVYLKCLGEIAVPQRV
jgi:hypothetical protein